MKHGARLLDLKTSRQYNDINDSHSGQRPLFTTPKLQASVSGKSYIMELGKLKKHFRRLAGLFLFIIALIAFQVIFAPLGKMKFAEDGQIFIAVIKDVNLGIDRGKNIKYYYQPQKAQIVTNQEGTYNEIFHNRKSFIGEKFPVICSTSDPSESYILILVKDFEAFGLVRPDSLNWICDSLNICD